MRKALNDLLPDTNYAIRIRAVSESAVSEWSTIYEFTTIADGILPEEPTMVSWVSSGDSFHAEWDAVSTNVQGDSIPVTRYEVELTANGVTKYDSVAPSTGNRVIYDLSFESNRAMFGVPRPTVSLRVRAVDNKELKSDWSIPSVSASNAVPSPPASVNSVGISDGISLSWAAPADVDIIGYNIYNNSNTKVAFVNGTTYTYSTSNYTSQVMKVAAVDKFNQESSLANAPAATPVNPFLVDTTPPNSATSLVASMAFDAALQQAYADLSWSASSSSDVKDYEIRYSMQTGNWNYVRVPGDQTSFRINNLFPNSPYYFAIRARDTYGNVSGWVNANSYPYTSSADTTAPSQPAAPTAAVGTQRVQVSVSGIKQAGGSMEPDVSYYEVFASTTSGFTTYDSTTMLGTIQAGPAMVETFQIPASAASGTSQTWYVKVRAVDRSGNISAASNQATAAVGLILTANIGDAQITNAKIGTVSVDKLIAGTGIANDFTIKSVLTLGEAGNDGEIRSYDYTTSGGTAGFSLDSDGLIIKTGQIEAAALRIQDSANLVDSRYSSFEANNLGLTAQNLVASIADSATAKFGGRTLATNWSAQASTPTVFLGSSITDYNQGGLEVGSEYIFSAYLRVTGAVATTVRAKIKWSNGTTSNAIFTANPTTGSTTWVRYSGTITAVTENYLILFDSPSLTANSGFDVDGLQMEKKISGSTSPSQWKAPGLTAIDGGLIRTGAIQSTTSAYDAAGNAISGVRAWQINTTGQAIFGDVLIRGSLVMGLAGTEPVATPGTEENLTGVSVMKSYNYQPGVSGWAIKSNGNAEFLQLAADSIQSDAISAVSPDKLNPGTVTADLIVGSSLGALDRTTIYPTTKSLTSNVATLTFAEPHGRVVGDRIKVSLEPADPKFDTPADNFVPITAVTDTTISYVSVNSNTASTATEGEVDALGRSVTMTPQGITLWANDGLSPIITLPTDSSVSAKYSGNVEANSLTVLDDFQLQGPENYISAGSVLTLNAAVVAPASTPTAASSWDSVVTTIDTDNSFFKSGLYYSSTISSYVTTNSFYGGGVELFSSSGQRTAFIGLKQGGSAYGVTRIGSNWYALELVNIPGTENARWMVVKYQNSGDGFSTVEGSWEYLENSHSTFQVTLNEWRSLGWTGSALRDPAIGTDGTNIYIARCNKNGSIVVSWYDTAGNRLGIVKTNIIDLQHLKSINVGAFDFGATRWVITSKGFAGSTAKNYVTNTSGTHQTAETWDSPGGVNLIGTTWNASESKFYSLAENKRMYAHTGVAKNGSTTWYVKSSWYDGNNSRTVNISNRSGNGSTTTITTSTAHGYVAGDIVYITGTSTALDNAYYTIATAPTTTTFTIPSAYNGSAGAAGTVNNEWETAMSSSYSKITVPRRANVTLSTTAVPSGAGNNVPDRAIFYISKSAAAGPYYRQTNSAASNQQKFTTEPVQSGNTGTRTPFPDGTPAILKSNNGRLEVSADGYGLFGASQDASTAAGNKPPLRVGPPAGNHLRIDGNEIISMDSDAVQGIFYTNPGGETRAATLRATGTTTLENVTLNGVISGNGAVNVNNYIKGTRVLASAPNTTTNAANTRWASANQEYQYISSLAKHKVYRRSITEAEAMGLLNVTPQTWYDRNEFDENGKSRTGLTRIPGFVAEDMELNARLFADYDRDTGELIGVLYDRVAAGLTVIVKKHEQLIGELAAKNAELEARLLEITG